MRKIVGILVASLLIGVTVFMLVVGADNREVPKADAIVRGAEEEVARQKADDAAAAQAALTAAAVASVVNAFDETHTARGHAIRKARQELKSIRINTGLLARNEAARVAERLTQPTMVPRLGYAYGMDLFAEGDRVWTLFDEAMGPGMEQVIEDDAARYSKQLGLHRQDLLNTQGRFGTALNQAVAPLNRANTVAMPPVSRRFHKVTQGPKIQRSVLAAIGSRLRTRYPEMLKHGIVKLGIKEVARAPAAAVDGPIPIMETGLVLWGLYDVVGSAASAWTAAEREIAAAAVDEVDGLALGQLKAAAQQLYAAEEEGRAARCVALAAALKPLAVARAAQDYERRCT